MKISQILTDDAVMRELGVRVAGARIACNLTQSDLAEQAGVSKRTVERLESGAVATQLSGFLRICRTLGYLDRLDIFLPEAVLGPMAQLKQQGRKRHRATGKKVASSVQKPWTWEDAK